tara:strand:+ start:1058 stop:1426 length:369 start_codon:yes stop_codon:yes gene_type:complete
MKSVAVTLYRHILKDFKKLNPSICIKKGIITVQDHSLYSQCYECECEYERELERDYEYHYVEMNDDYNLNLKLPMVYKDKYMNSISFLKYNIQIGDKNDIDDLFEIYKNLRDYSDDIKTMMI